MSATGATFTQLGIWLALLAAAGWRLGALGSVRLEHRRTVRFAVRSGLPGGVGPELVRRVVRRQRFVLAGVGLGVLAATATGSIAMLWVGLAVGALADQLVTPAVPADTPRVAHTTGTRLTDYVPGWLVWAVVAAFACTPLLALLRVLAPQGAPDADMPRTSEAEMAGLVTVAAAGLAGSLLLARFMVRRRQRASSTADLATDDAFRAQAVRDALHLSAATSLAVAFRLSTALQDPAVQGAARHVGGWAPLVLLLAVAVVGNTHEFTGGAKHWRSQLGAA